MTAASAARAAQLAAVERAVTEHPGCTVYELTEHVPAEPATEGLLEVFATPSPRILCGPLLTLLGQLKRAGKAREEPAPAGGRWYPS